MTINQIQAVKKIDFCDWIPVVSTATNLYHIFKRATNASLPTSTHGLYLRKITLVENILLLIPIVNIAVKFFNHMRNTKNAILDAVGFNGMYLQNAPIELSDDFDVVLAAVSENGLALEFASSSKQNDRTIVQAAITNDARALNFASTALQTDPAVLRLISRR